MAEYIEREEVKEWIADWLRNDKYWHPYSKGKNIPTVEVFDILSHIPTADVQPVKHGRWIPRILPFNKAGNECSICLAISVGAMKPYYCPNCGAKMDGEKWMN